MRWYVAVLAALLASVGPPSLRLRSAGLRTDSTQVMPDGLRRNPLQQLGSLPKTEDAIHWVLAATSHEPGVLDAAAIEIGSWPPNRLAEAFGHVAALKNSEAYNAVLARGAMLHADLSLLRRGNGLPPPSGDPRNSSQLFMDGRLIGVSGRDEQLVFARHVMASMKPPGGDSRALQWFRAIGADFADRYWLLDLVLHNEEARRLFPKSAKVLFDSGCEAETITAPRLQVAVASSLAAPPGGLRRPSGEQLTPEFNLTKAERFYREAVAVDPSMTEAKVRLAHVLLQKRRFKDAVSILEGDIHTTDANVLYFAAMTRGRLMQQTLHPDEARRSFSEASTLFPSAQSPLLALAALAREQGDETSASVAMTRLSALATTDPWRDDPWWLYYECNGRNVVGELLRLRYAFRTGGAK
jgi:tetratricopeptide (TPR) repeat protein